MHEDPNLQLLEDAARALEPLLGEVVFVGGCVTGLLITDPAPAGVRPTTDVDVIAEVYSYAQYDGLSARLRELGLSEDNREGAPTCRWRHGDGCGSFSSAVQKGPWGSASGMKRAT